MTIAKLEERAAMLLSDPARRDDPVLNLLSELVDDRQKLSQQIDVLTAALSEASKTDALTGLSSRRAMADRLNVEENRAFRSGRPFIVVRIDIDHLDAAHGPEGADAVRKELSRLLLADLRNFDLCARWAGEEFLVLLVETPAAKAFAMIEKLRARVAERPILHLGDEISFTVSAGLAVHDPTESVDSTVRQADTALNAAKTAGGNRVLAAAAP